MQLSATFTQKQDWGISGDSTPEDRSSDEEDNEPLDDGLTNAQRTELGEIREEGSDTLYKE
jgi:hypothetical protein